MTKFEDCLKHVLLHCSMCGRPLVDILVVQPDAPCEFVFRAQCCYCPPTEYSFARAVQGRVQIGGYGVTRSDDGEDADVYTKALTPIIEKDLVTIPTFKVK